MKPEYSTAIRDLLHASVGRTANLVLPPVTRFAVISSGRSGSNFLNSLMRSHRRVVQHGEIFGEFHLEAQSVRDRINRAGIIGYLNRRLDRMGIEHATGIKLLYNNFEERYGHVRGIPGTEQILPYMIEDPDIRIVHLVREDKLATLISHELAMGSKQWVKGGYGARTVHLDPDWVQGMFEKIDRWEARIPTLFADNRRLDMTYDTLVSQTESEMKRVFDFLNLAPVAVKSPLTKQNKRAKSQVVENFNELRQAFAGTPYEDLIRE